jgi:hypothetical protein
VRALPAEIAYAKNPKHELFLRAFQGKLKGRYHSSLLVSIESLGSRQIRHDIENALGRPAYLPDEWYPARDVIVMFDRAVRAGVPAEKIGMLVMPTYKRARPKLFEEKTVREGFDLLERAYRLDTTYGGVSPGPCVDPMRMLVYRKGSPFPCEYFVGVIKGLLALFSVEGTVREVDCQWNGASMCCFEARWES